MEEFATVGNWKFSNLELFYCNVALANIITYWRGSAKQCSGRPSFPLGTYVVPLLPRPKRRDRSAWNCKIEHLFSWDYRCAETIGMGFTEGDSPNTWAIGLRFTNTLPYLLTFTLCYLPFLPWTRIKYAPFARPQNESNDAVWRSIRKCLSGVALP